MSENKNKSTEDLIKELSSSHTKISADFSPFIRTISFSLVLTIVSLFLMQLHQPLNISLKNSQQFIEIILGTFITFSVVYVGFNSFVPGSNKKHVRILLLSSSFFFIILVLLSSLSPQTYNVMRSFCEIEAMSISLLSTLVSHLLFKKNEYAQSSLTSSLVVLGLPMLASILLHSSCSLEFGHVILCHVAAPLMIPIAYLSTRKYWLK